MFDIDFASLDGHRFDGTFDCDSVDWSAFFFDVIGQELVELVAEEDGEVLLFGCCIEAAADVDVRR